MFHTAADAFNWTITVISWTDGRIPERQTQITVISHPNHITRGRQLLSAHM